VCHPRGCLLEDHAGGGSDRNLRTLDPG
jgi:hypothetical protein